MASLKIFGSCRIPYYFMFPFHLFLMHYIIIHRSELCYFWSGKVDLWSQILVIPGGDVFFIIWKSQLLLLQYFHIFFLILFKGGDGLFPHIILCCVLEENISIWFLNPIFSEGNHHIICYDLLYLDIFNGLLCYCIDLLIIGYIKNLDRENTCLNFCSKVGRTEGK